MKHPASAARAARRRCASSPSRRTCASNIPRSRHERRSYFLSRAQAGRLYPHARRVGNLLFLSGIGPREPATDAIPGDFAAQCLSVFRNIRAILEDAGSAWANIVDVTVFLTNMKDDFATFNKLYAEHFAECRPAHHR